MNLKLTRPDQWRIGIATGALLLLLLVGWFAVDTLAVGITLISAVALLMLLQTQQFRQQEALIRKTAKNQYETERERLETHFAQTEALLSIYFSVQSPIEPLPKTRGWAASPDFLRLVTMLIRQDRPRLIVELGSGVSTLVCGYVLQKNGSGKLISFDHLDKFGKKTRQMVDVHGLGERCVILHAPLKTYELGGSTWQWYDLDEFLPEQPVDMVIVDGPPGNIQKLSRYPALPLLTPYLSSRAVIIVDDGAREDETAMVNQWIEEFPRFTSEYIEGEKGAYVLKPA